MNIPGIPNVPLTKKQEKTLEEFDQMFGVFDIVDSGVMIQIQLTKITAQDEGISFHWLEKLSKCFYGISIATSTSKKYAMYITMFKNNADGHVSF
jgi:hypothetical protein